MSNETKLTAVQWFAQKDNALTILFLEGRLTQVQLAIEKQKCWNEAVEMEKKQMQHWFGLGMHLVEGRIWKPIDKFEEKFNETYGGNK